jgi:multidrug efflux pump subunit AcrB
MFTAAVSIGLIIAVLLVAAVLVHPVLTARMAAEERQRRMARQRAQEFEAELRIHEVVKAAQAQILRVLIEHRGQGGRQP